jgi:signal transduction histidine kinase
MPMSLLRSLTARTLVVSSAFAVLLCATVIVLIVAMRDQRTAGRLALRAQETRTAVADLERTVVTLDNGLRAFVATGRERALRPFTSARRIYPAQLRTLTRLVRAEPDARRDLLRIRAKIDDYVGLWAVPLIGVARERINVARNVISNNNGRLRIEDVRGEFARLAARERSLAARREHTAERRSSVATVLGISAIVLVLALTLLLLLAVRRAVIRPVIAVVGAMGAVRHGRLDARVASARRDEVGELARGFNAMAASLQRGHRELERSNADLADFASVASHDLQEPLMTITMLADRLEGRLPASAAHEAELASHINATARRLRQLVRDLLGYSRVGRSELKAEDVPLADVARQALENLEASIRATGARVTVEPLPVVRGDRSRLCRVIQNLVANAVKFCDGKAPEVRISSTASAKEHVVSVADNGMGLRPEDAERIFRPFQRATGAASYEGSGIGLAVCQRIVAQHGGRIWADGRVGEGATFSFTLPRPDQGAS